MAQVTVYHIAIPHQEEIRREWLPEIERSASGENREGVRISHVRYAMLSVN
ncbi:MAG: hypothetical protein J7I99_01055 [Methanophagales archaeon]|nr:hypothetical protein [Methanophagales archaeon]